MNNNNNGYMYKSGNIEEIVSATFDNILKLSNLGLKRDNDFIKRLSLALKMLSKVNKYLSIESSEFMYPFIAYDDFNTGKTYMVYFDGINDSLVIREINSPGIGSNKLGFAIGCMVDPVGGNNTCITAWPDPEHCISNAEFLEILSSYGFMMSGVLAKSDLLGKPSDVAASALFDIINANGYFLDGIDIVSSIKSGLENIVNLNISPAEEYDKPSELLIGFIDVISKLMYYIMYNKEDGVVTLVAKEGILSGDTSGGDIYMIYKKCDGSIDNIGVNTSKISESNGHIPFIDIVKSMIDIMIII